MSYLHLSTIDQVKAIPIERVYSRYASGNLRRIGNRLEVRCPIHSGGQEKHPSFNLYPDKNSCRCYGCGVGGDTISLVMALLKCSFKDAVRTIALDFGIPLTGATKEERQQTRIKSFQLKAERELEARGRRVESEAYQILSSLYRAVTSSLTDINTVEDMEQVGGLYHISTSLENYLEVLRCGTPEERKLALADARRGGWC